jgi:hypothetical protein
MSIIDRFTSTRDLLTETHSDDQQQNSDRVLNPETRRALGRELRATRRLWAVILAFVPFVYASVAIWMLSLPLHLFIMFLAVDALAGIVASMAVAIRLNLILRPRGESQALADADSTEAEIEARHEAMEGGPEASKETDDTDPSEDEDGIHPVGESNSSTDETDVPTGEEASSQQATESAGEDQVESTGDPPQCPDCEESDRWSADGHNGNLVCDSCGYMPEKQVRDEIRRKRSAQGENTADEQAETQRTDDSTDMTSERIIS